MKFLFSDMMGVIHREERTAQEVTPVGVSVKNESRSSLRTSYYLKLSTAAREALPDKFSFFELNRKIGEYFKAVYDLHMRASIAF